jgi:hypothetical protein
MRLEPKAFGLAAGIVATVLFVICATAVALAPEAATAVGGFLFHADLSSFTRSVSWSNFVGGLAGWSLGTAAVSTLVAVLYNRLRGATG